MSLLTGQKGPQGIDGQPGNPGPTGMDGMYGFQGIPYPYNGPFGNSGLSGMEGPQGIAGPTGKMGPTGQNGLRGATGNDGLQGPIGITGSAYAYTKSWITYGTNTYSTNPGNIGINNANPAYNIDVSGSLNISKITYVTNMCEFITTLTAISTNTYNIDYSKGSLFFLSTAPTSTMTIRIFNLPSLTDTTRSYILNFIYKGTSANNYVNSVNVTKTSTPGSGVSNITPKFLQPIFLSSITSANLIFQTVVYFYLGGSAYVVSSVNGYGS